MKLSAMKDRKNQAMKLLAEAAKKEGITSYRVGLQIYKQFHKRLFPKGSGIPLDPAHNPLEAYGVTFYYDSSLHELKIETGTPAYLTKTD